MFTLYALLTTAAIAADPFVFQHENVLGTVLELRVEADSVEAAQQAETAALAEIDRLTAIFSTYDANSELSRWWQSGESRRLSPELIEVLRASDHWRTVTNGAFHPGVEVISRLWKQGEQTGRVPTTAELQPVVARLQSPPWQWTGAAVVTPNRYYPITLNAIAKGAIIDYAGRRMLESPGVTGAMIKIGGDLRVLGSLTVPVDLSEPTSSVLPMRLLDEIAFRNQALATSSGAFRGVSIEGRRYSHLIDPRTGQPVDHVRSATVLATDAMTADALSTACSVLSVEESLALLDATPDAAGLLLDRDGKLHRSRRWPNREQVVIAAEPKPWNGGMELEVQFEINQPADGSRYRRPYVAVWVENSDGFPVRTLVLWVQTSGPGPRWIPDLKRWYRSDRTRKMKEETDLIRTVSEATRKPGSYSVIWNGTDNAGELVKPGDYTLFIESAREHGTYQLIRKAITVRDQPFQHKLDGNPEIKSATIEYRKAKPTSATTTGS